MEKLDVLFEEKTKKLAHMLNFQLEGESGCPMEKERGRGEGRR
jgi:hypothetical protein